MILDDWQQHWSDLVDKRYRLGYESLDPDERIWFNVRVLIDSIDNGGVISYYYNSGADNLYEALEDLRTIKAYRIIELLEEVNKLFPDGKPSKNIDERNDVISSWDEMDDGKLDDMLKDIDKEFYDLEEELEQRIGPYVKKLITR